MVPVDKSYINLFSINLRNIASLEIDIILAFICRSVPVRLGYKIIYAEYFGINQIKYDSLWRNEFVHLRLLSYLASKKCFNWIFY